MIVTRWCRGVLGVVSLLALAAGSTRADDCGVECAPLSSMVAVVLVDDGGTGATTIPDFMKARVAQLATGALPEGAVFPLANASTDSVRALPELQVNVVVEWLDPLGPSEAVDAPRFGANCDYIAYFGEGWDADWDGSVVGGAPQWGGSATEGWVWVNHEYISNGRPLATSAPSGQHLTFARFLRDSGVLVNDVESNVWPQSAISTYTEWYKKQLGGAWFRIVQDEVTGEWHVDRTAQGVRYDSTSETLLTVTGYTLNSLGHDDFGFPLPAGVAPGIAGDCSGGQTPWGTIFTAEENVQSYYGDLEACWTSSQRFIPGTGFDAGAPISPPFAASPTAEFSLHSSVSQRHERDNYGFMGEMDPGVAASDYYESSAAGGDGVGHRKVGGMGRARWENAAFVTDGEFQLVEGQPIVTYGGNDRRSGRIWKYVTSAPYEEGMTKAEVRALLDEGRLYVAHFAGLENTDGITLHETGEVPTEAAPGVGQWLYVSVDSTDTPPNAAALGVPEMTIGEALQDPEYNGIGAFPDDNAVLSALFTAACKIGVMELNRPEDIEWNPNDLSGTPRAYVAFTNNGRQVALDQDGVLYSPDDHAVNSPARPDPWGSIYAMEEADPAAPGASMTFEYWALWLGVGGDGLYDAANPDNLAVDADGGLWFGTDGNFGRNGTSDAIYYIDTDPAHAEGAEGVVTSTYGQAFRFVAGPDDSEATGPAFNADGASFFFNVQHPGEGSSRQSVWPNIGFQLALDGPGALEVTSGGTTTASYDVMLGQSGQESGAQAWSYGLRAENASITSIEFDGSQAAAVFAEETGGFAVHEVVDDGATGAVLLSYTAAATLPAGFPTSLATIEVAVSPVGPVPDTATIEFADDVGRFGRPVALEVVYGGEEFEPATNDFEIQLISLPTFVRGDADEDGDVSIADGVRIFGNLFTDPIPTDCAAASDANDDDLLDVSDGIYVLNFLFLGGAMIPEPYPTCGVDPTEGELGCVFHGGCF